MAAEVNVVVRPEYRAQRRVQTAAAGGNEGVNELTRCPIEALDATVGIVGDIQIAFRSKTKLMDVHPGQRREQRSGLPRSGQGRARCPVVAQDGTRAAIAAEMARVEVAVRAEQQFSWAFQPATACGNKDVEEDPRRSTVTEHAVVRLAVDVQVAVPAQ